jgi:hypothetical protein
VQTSISIARLIVKLVERDQEASSSLTLGVSIESYETWPLRLGEARALLVREVSGKTASKI